MRTGTILSKFKIQNSKVKRFGLWYIKLKGRSENLKVWVVKLKGRSENLKVWAVLYSG